MKTKKFPMALLFASSLTLVAQQDAKPSPYEGVSHPPADDSIVVTSSTDVPKPATAAKPNPAVPATPKPATQTNQTIVPASDADIVSLPPAATVASANTTTGDSTTSSTTLHTRTTPTIPDGDIVEVPPAKPGELRAGTPIYASLLTALSTKETPQGQPFSSKVTVNVIEDGKVIIPAGSEIKGRVTEVNEGNHFGSRATLHLRPDVVILPDGSKYQLHAQVVDTKGTDTRATSEGSITPQSHGKRDVAQYAMFAGSGALIGAKFGGAPGALIGTLVGAGIVTTHKLLHNPQAELPKDSNIVFSLTEPMELSPIQN